MIFEGLQTLCSKKRVPKTADHLRTVTTKTHSSSLIKITAALAAVRSKLHASSPSPSRRYGLMSRSAIRKSVVSRRRRSQAEAERHLGGEADVAVGGRVEGDALQRASGGALPAAVAVLVNDEHHAVRLGIVAGRLDLQACRQWSTVSTLGSLNWRAQRNVVALRAGSKRHNGIEWLCVTAKDSERQQNIRMTGDEE